MSREREQAFKRLIDTESRDIRHRLRDAFQRNEGVQSRRDNERDREVRDDFIDHIRRQPSNNAFDPPESSPSHVHVSPRSQSSQSVSSSMSVLPRDIDPFQPSSPVMRSPAVSQAQIAALVNEYRRASPSMNARLPSSSLSRRSSPQPSSSTPPVAPSALQGERSHHDIDEDDEEHDDFVRIENESSSIPLRDREVPSSASNEHMKYPPRSHSGSATPATSSSSYPLRRQDAGHYTNQSLFDTSHSTNFTPGSQLADNYLQNEMKEQKMREMEERLMRMERMLLQQKQEVQTKDEIINSLLSRQDKKKGEEERTRADMQADSRQLIRDAARASRRIQPATAPLQPSSHNHNHNALTVESKNDHVQQNTSSLSSSLPSDPRSATSPEINKFPSLSPSSSPSLVVSAPIKTEPRVATHESIIEPLTKNEIIGKKDYEEDEYKYNTDVSDSKNDVKKLTKSTIGDLPEAASEIDDEEEEELDLSADEATIRRKDQQADKIIKERVEEDEDHLTNYPMWAELRESIYPYAKNQKLYKTRFSLLSERDRRNEWMRFGVTVHFRPNLYGHTARHWFENFMIAHGVPLKDSDANRPVRNASVDRPPFEVPRMAYDPRDSYDPEEITSPTDQDLEDYNFTFEKLPDAIRNKPPIHEREPAHHMDLIQVAYRYAQQYKMKLLANQPVTPKEKPITTEMRGEEHPCARCKTPVYSILKRMCSKCEEKYEVEKRKAIANGYLPPLASVPSISLPPTSSSMYAEANTAPTYINRISSSQVKSEPSNVASSFLVNMGPYEGSSIVSSTNHESESSNVRVKREPTKLTYEEQEEELSIIQNKTKLVVKSVTSTDEDREEEDDSPLGDILAYVFQPYERAMQRAMRRNDISLHTFRDRATAVNSAVTSIGKFDGSVVTAPKYLFDLCTQVQTYGFVEREVIGIMDRTMIGNAQTWLHSNKYECFNVKYKPLQVLLHRFRSQFLGPHVTRDLRKQMSSTILTTNNPSSKDLDTHYNTYQTLVSRLRMSDKFVDDEETKTEFFTSLPKSLKDFIGNDSFRAKTPHDIYVMAQKALMMSAPRTGVKQDGDLPRSEVININAMPSGGKPKSKHEPKDGGNYKKRTPTTSEDQNKRTAMCYHCGDRGHWTGDCPLGKDAQTLRGQQAYAKYCKDRGQSWPYSFQFWVDLAKRFAQPRSNNTDANANRSQSSSRKKRHNRQAASINEDADHNAVEVIVDEED